MIPILTVECTWILNRFTAAVQIKTKLAQLCSFIHQLQILPRFRNFCCLLHCRMCELISKTSFQKFWISGSSHKQWIKVPLAPHLANISGILESNLFNNVGVTHVVATSVNRLYLSFQTDPLPHFNSSPRSEDVWELSLMLL